MNIKEYSLDALENIRVQKETQNETWRRMIHDLKQEISQWENFIEFNQFDLDQINDELEKESQNEKTKFD